MYNDDGDRMLMWEDGFCNVERGRAVAPTYAQCMNMNHHNHGNNNSINNVMGAFDMNGHDHHEAPVWRSFRKMSIQLYNYGEG